MKNNPEEIISELYEFAVKEKLEHIELKNQNFYVRIKRKSKKNQTPNVPLIIGYPSIEEKREEKIQYNTIKSPLNGVFYRAPSPSSAPFVVEGDIVEPGMTLCIIEAMKVMNEIKAEKRCKIIKILVENGQSVTSGQDIFAISEA
jgi:acetyl-CoA carboxylase biotin carboxyl carrier protein